MTEKEKLQEKARAAGVDPSGTMAEIQARIDAASSASAGVGNDTADTAPESSPGATSTLEANAALEHSVTGRTTRSDRTDAGVPMLPGEAREPVGPEDALGVGPKRGDYRDRVPGNPHESRPIAGGGEPVYRDDDDGNAVVVDYAPRSELVAQAPRTQDIGDAAGVKGGVQTDPLARTPAA